MSKLWTLLILTSSLFGTHAATAGEERTVTFNVEKMTCATCPITVRAATQRVDGVKTVKVDIERKIATVTYDASVTNTNDIGMHRPTLGFPLPNSERTVHDRFAAYYRSLFDVNVS